MLTERGGAEIEVRYTYDEPHIPADFKQSEYLDEAEWLWLRDQLAHRSGSTVMLSMPPGVGEPKAQSGESTAVQAPTSPPLPVAADDDTPPGFLPGRYGIRLIWNGQMEIRRVWGGSGPPTPSEVLLKTIDVRDIGDPEAFLASLPI